MIIFVKGIKYLTKVQLSLKDKNTINN
jgi:hypothetical protein